MADLFKLRVITPDKKFYEGDVKMVEFNTTEGNIGIYKDHIPLTSIIAPGVLSIHEENRILRAALMAGFAEILQDEVTVMAEIAEWPEEIDLERAKEAQERARKRLSETSADVDTMRAELALRRALVRLELKK